MLLAAVNRLAAVETLQRYAGPALVLHGERDNVIPVDRGHALAAAARRACLRILLCGHNDCPPQWELVLGFLAWNGVFSEQEEGDLP